MGPRGSADPTHDRRDGLPPVRDFSPDAEGNPAAQSTTPCHIRRRVRHFRSRPPAPRRLDPRASLPPRCPMPLSDATIAELRARLGEPQVLTAPEDLITYSFDGTAALHQMPGCVVFARSAADVVAVLEIATRTLTAVVTRGSGTAVDKKRAVDVALKVGEQGDARQTYNVADFFTGYTGLDPSLEMFILMHRIAADKGNIDSCDELGRIYSGEEVIGFKVNYPISVDEALKYFKRGAYPDGEYNHVYRLSCLLYLGDMYRRGIGCQADPEMAAKVYFDYLEAFRKIDFSGTTVFAHGGKVRMLWLKSHYPDLAGVPELNDPRLRFDGIVDYMHSFKHFGKVDFDYELFDEIAKIVSMRGKNEKDNFQRACTYVAREFGAKDCLFHFVNLEYGEEFNSYSYEAYKDAALSGSATAAFRLHDMLVRQSFKPGTLNGGPEFALSLYSGRNNHELVIAYGEKEAWRRFGAALESMLNAGRSLKRDCRKVAAPIPLLYVRVKDEDEASQVLPILRKINEIYRERLAKESTTR